MLVAFPLIPCFWLIFFWTISFHVFLLIHRPVRGLSFLTWTIIEIFWLISMFSISSVLSNPHPLLPKYISISHRIIVLDSAAHYVISYSYQIINSMILFVLLILFNKVQVQHSGLSLSESKPNLGLHLCPLSSHIFHSVSESFIVTKYFVLFSNIVLFFLQPWLHSCSKI